MAGFDDFPEASSSFDEFPEFDANEFPEVKEDSRGVLDKFSDFMYEGVGAFADSAQAVTSLVNPNIRVAEDLAKTARSYKTPEAQEGAKERERKLQIAQGADDGLFSGTAQRFENIAEAPLETAAQVVGGLAGPVGVGALAKAAVGAKTAIGAAAGTSGAIGAGSVRENYFKGVKATGDEQLIAENPAYAAIRARGVSEAEAKDILANQVSKRLALGMTAQAAIDALTTVWGGAEKALLSGVKSKAVGQLAKTGGKEAVGELVSAADEAYQSGVGMQEAVPSTNPLRGVGTAGLEGGALGGAAGVGAGMVAPRTARPPVIKPGTNAAADLEAFKAKAAAEKAAGPTKVVIPFYPPVVEVTAEDGSVSTRAPVDQNPVMVEVSTDSQMYRAHMAEQEAAKGQRELPLTNAVEQDPAQTEQLGLFEGGQDQPNLPARPSMGLSQDTERKAVPLNQGMMDGPTQVAPPDATPPMTQDELFSPAAENDPNAGAYGMPERMPDLPRAMVPTPIDIVSDAPPAPTGATASVNKLVKRLQQAKGKYGSYRTEPTIDDDADTLPRLTNDTPRTDRGGSLVANTMKGKPPQEGYRRLAKGASNTRIGYLFERIGYLIDMMSQQGVRVFVAGEPNLRVSGVKAHGAAQFNFPESRVIVKYDAADLDKATMEATLAHEGIHAVTGSLIEANKNPEWRKANPGLSEKINRLEDLYETAKVTLRSQGVDTRLLREATANVHEFIAYGLTSPGIIKALKQTKTEKSNLFMDMIRRIGDLLGIRPADFNMYAELVAVFDAISMDPNVNSMYKDSFKVVKKLDTHAEFAEMSGIEEYEPVSVEAARDEMLARPWDIEKSRVGQLLRSGIRHLAIDTNHPLIKATHTVIDKALSSKRNEMRRIMGTKGDTLVSRMQKIPKQERALVREILITADKLQADIGPDDFPNLSQASRDFIQKNQEELAKLLEYHNVRAELVGNDPIKARGGYSPASFGGRFRSLVTVKQGGKIVPIGYVGENTTGAYSKALEWVKAEYPGATITKLPDRRSREGKSVEQQESLVDLIRQLDVDIDENLLEAARIMDNKLFGMDKREKSKLGIWGSEGNKPWAKDDQNNSEYFDALFGYYDEAFTHAALQPALKNIRALGNEFRDQAPNAIFEMQEYTKHVTGRNLNSAGVFANNLVDGVMARIDNITGGNSAKATGILRDQLTTLALGWFNTQYLAAQLLQPFQTAAPFAKLVTHRYGISNLHIARAMSNSGLQYAAYVAGMKVKPETQMILDYAQANGLTGMSHLEHKSAINKGPVNRAVDAMGQGVIQAGETLTRLPMFLMFTDLIRKSPAGQQMDMEKILDTAKNLTQYSMVDYNPEQRPQLYSELGFAGSLLGTFRTYQHGNISQMKTLGKEALGKKGEADVAPIFMMMSVLMLLGGTMGVPLVEEAEMLMKAAGMKETPKQWMLKSLPPEVSKGYLSEMTGFDLNSKYAFNAVIPNSFPMAHAQQAWKPLVAAFELINNDVLRNGKVTPQAAKNLGKEVMPSSFRNIFDTYANVDEEAMVLRGKDNTAAVDLTQDDLAKRKSVAGLVTQAKPLKESMRRAIDFENSYRNLKNQEAQARIKADMKRYLGQDMLTEPMIERMAQLYIEKGGDPKNFLSGLDTYVKDRNMPYVLRGIERGKANQRKLQSLDNKYR